MRFVSDHIYFDYYKDKNKIKLVEFKNIPEYIQNIINSTNNNKIQWKYYYKQLIGGQRVSSKYL
ncbi:hypothetical protein [Spiroplasma endosymbiont of Polydrusus formosus]|uniref:hypothetical protein n=1 Tax=Spiroplasma endosymbiont of Polydrusus formosus TaxID=3139326 RepID=UPI0035B53CFB